MCAELVSTDVEEVWPRGIDCFRVYPAYLPEPEWAFKGLLPTGMPLTHACQCVWSQLWKLIQMLHAGRRVSGMSMEGVIFVMAGRRRGDPRQQCFQPPFNH